MAKVKVDAHKCEECDGVIRVEIGEKYRMVLTVQEAVHLLQGLGAQMGPGEPTNGKAKHSTAVESDGQGVCSD